MGENKNYMAGYYVLPRLTEIQTRDKLLFGLMVEMANYRDGEGCKRGQLFTSTRQLSRETGWSEMQVRTSLKRLKERGMLIIETFRDRQKGMKVTIPHYDDMQRLDSYGKNNESNIKSDNECYNESATNENPCASKGETYYNKANNESSNKYDNEGDTDSLTTVLTTNKRQVKQKKELMDLPEQIRSKEDVEAFVDSQLLANAIPLPRRLFIEYFNTIRLVRNTGRLSVNVAAKVWDKLYRSYTNPKQTPDANKSILLYALSVHIMSHDDKDEAYTFGIIRRTSEHEARQKYMRLVNRRNENGQSRGENNEPSEISDKQRRADELNSLSL